MKKGRPAHKISVLCEKKLNDKVETLFLMSDPQNQIISSKLVKEIADLKGNVKKFTTKSVLKHLKLKLND